MAEAFSFTALKAVEQKADVFLIAGDLFNTAQIQPEHLKQAVNSLSILKEAGIPVFAIDGNHDRTFNQKTPSWLSYLNNEALIYHLTIPFTSDGPIISEWNNETREGSYIDYQNIRFIGSGYLGAGTPSRLQAILKTLPEAQPCEIMLLHAGPDYFVGEGGGFSISKDLPALKERIHYLALGHIHKPMIHQNWACNPGSPENLDIRESHYALKNGARGCAVIDIDPAESCPTPNIEIINTPKRTINSFELDCTEFGNKTKHGSDSLKKSIYKQIEAENIPADSVLEIKLTGEVKLQRLAFDIEQLEAEIENDFSLAAAKIDTNGINSANSMSNNSIQDFRSQRNAIEKKAISSLIENDPLFNEKDTSMLCDFFYTIKNKIEANEADQIIAELIQSHEATASINETQA